MHTVGSDSHVPHARRGDARRSCALTRHAITLLCLAGLALCSACPTTFAQSAQVFPNRTVRIISPYGAGTGPDVVVRMVVDRLSRAWKQPVIVEARPGGGGIPAMEAAKAAPADGHHLVMAADAQLSIAPHLFRSLPYDPQTDFEPIAGLYSSPFYVMVAANGRYRTLADLTADARSAPNKVAYGVPAVGSPAHLGAAMLASLTGSEMLPVPFRETQQLFIAILNGDVGWTLSTPGTASGFFVSGAIKPIAVAQKVRSPHFPDVPTIVEAGGPPEIEIVPWLALLAPRGTPADVVRTINAGVTAALGDPTVRERLRALGFTPMATSPDEAAQRLRADRLRYGELVHLAGAATQ
jgi:tripartite-type tricarboxylate transporter receptor subunit TctC